MSGVERLRALAGAWDEWGLGGTLAEMADQVERERACDEDTIENIRLIVGGVVDEMERHILGHEGMEESPVASWARELREALGGEEHDPADDVSMSAYDLLPQEDREAVAWVREHGGLDAVKTHWKRISYYADPVPRSYAEKRIAKLQRQIDESHAALRRRRETISELNRRARDLTRENAELRKRAMPEGMCWPVFEDGEPVLIGDKADDIVVRSVVFQETGVLVTDGTSLPGWNKWRRYKEPFPRTAPKVLDADGAEIYKGRIAYGTRGRKYRVTELCEYEPSIVHAQAIDDGELGDEFIAANTGLNSYQLDASKLTHERPEIDSWKRLEEDATVSPEAYCAKRGIDFSDVDGQHRVLDEVTERMARDIVRRCRALAERERGE